MKLATLLLAVPTAVSALAGDVLEVGPNRALTTIGEALSLASPDDIVLIDPATYVENLDLRSGIVLLGRNGVPTIDGYMTIETIAGTQAVLLSSIRLHLATDVSRPPQVPILAIDECRGAVHLRSVEISEERFVTPSASPRPGREGVMVTGSNNVVLMDSRVEGGPARSAGLFGIIPGGQGLTVGRLATVELADSEVVGGLGATSENAGSGGAGVLVSAGGTLFALGGSITGGDGGDALGNTGGSGGAGLVTQGSFASLLAGRATLQDVTLAGGQPGEAPFGIPGTEGPARTGNGLFTDLFGEPRRLFVPAVVRETEPGFVATTSGLELGETASLLAAPRSGYRFAPTLERPLRVLIGAQGFVQFFPLQADASGESALPFGPTVPPAGEDGFVFWTQSLCRTTAGETRWSSSRATVLLGAQFIDALR